MSETKATMEAVYAAADELQQKGIRPSSRKIKDMIGGSNELILEHLEDWRVGRAPGGQDQKAPLPPRLQELLEGVARDFWIQSTGLADERLQTEQEQLTRVRHELRLDQLELEEQLDRAAEQAEQLTERLREMVEREQGTRAQLDTARADGSRLLERASVAEAHVKVLEHTARERAAEQERAERQRADERTELERRHGEELARVRDEAERRLAEARREGERQTEDLCAQLVDVREQARVAHAERQAERLDLRKELHEARAALESELQRRRDDQQVHQAELDGTRERLKVAEVACAAATAELEALRAQAALLRRLVTERDADDQQQGRQAPTT